MVRLLGQACGPETLFWEVKGMFPVRLGIVEQLCVPFVCRVHPAVSAKVIERVD